MCTTAIEHGDMRNSGSCLENSLDDVKEKPPFSNQTIFASLSFPPPTQMCQEWYFEMSEPHFGLPSNLPNTE